MGIIATATEVLDERRDAFSPAASGSTSTWTLRDALLVAVGCDRVAGPMAYWEWQDIHSAMKAARQRIAAETDAPDRMDAERWANQDGRSVGDVLAALDAAVNHGDIDPPGRVTLRPWCDPKIVTRCRIPYVPLAAVIHAWTLDGGTLSGLLDRYDVEPTTTSWTLLQSVDERISHTEPEQIVSETAWNLRIQMREESEPPVNLPAEWLAKLSLDYGEMDYLEFVDHIGNDSG